MAMIVFLLFWMTLVVSKDTPVGNFLRRVMVEMPAVAANRCSRVNLAIAIVTLLLIILLATAGDADPIRMASLFAPDLALWLATFEISAIIDAAMVLAAARAALSGLISASVVQPLGIRTARRSKSKTNRPRRSSRRSGALPANDDEDGPGLALAS